MLGSGLGTIASNVSGFAAEEAEIVGDAALTLFRGEFAVLA